MRRVVLLAAVIVGALVVPAEPSSASWVGDHCHDYFHPMSIYRPKDARAYVDIALKEGYEYGGGCWNDDNVDDTPGAPDSSGEGPDCSGLVFKTWALKKRWGYGGFEYWDPLMNIHGPYTSMTFHGVGMTSPLPFHRILKRDSTYMDAFARYSHVGLLYTGVRPVAGTFQYAEAKGDAYGTHVFEETWMADSAYVAVERKGWTPDCFPGCQRAQGSDDAVVVKL
jgi:hypothetical protein